MYATNSTNKQQACRHQFKTKTTLNSKTKIEVCIICNHSRKILDKNTTITDYIIPASEPTKFQNESPKPAIELTHIQEIVEMEKRLTNRDQVEYDGWRLPASGEPHCDCGVWKARGCLNVENHEKYGYGKSVYVVHYRSSCYRPRCSICYYWWIIRQANRATQRIRKYIKETHRAVFHIAFSLPLSEYSLSLKEWRKKLSNIMKDLGMFGGAAIIHSHRRERHDKSRYYFSPHFHVVGFGEIRGKIPLMRQKYGWEIFYLKERRSIFQTFCYLLSHAGIKKGCRSMIWLGELSYNKLQIKQEKKTNLCPCCNVKLVEIYKHGFDPAITVGKYFEGFVNSDGWYTLKPVDPPDKFEYSSIGHVNEILKGIATAN